jgi:hypothetical protein
VEKDGLGQGLGRRRGQPRRPEEGCTSEERGDRFSGSALTAIESKVKKSEGKEEESRFPQS